MSSLTIQERFTLDAEPEVVWQSLIDPEQVVCCLPGAELTGVNDDGAYQGSVKVRLGALTIGYRGTARFEETDHERRFVRVIGRGREKTGAGTVSMTMESMVAAGAEGGSEVTVDAEIKLTGKIVRFGRGMIQTVSAEIFNDFTRRLQRRIDAQTQELEAPDVPRDPTAEHEAPVIDPLVEDQPESLPLLTMLWRAFWRWTRGR